MTIEDLVAGWKEERERLVRAFLKLGVKANVIRWGEQDVTDEVRSDFTRRIAQIDALSDTAPRPRNLKGAPHVTAPHDDRSRSPSAPARVL